MISIHKTINANAMEMFWKHIPSTIKAILQIDSIQCQNASSGLRRGQGKLIYGISKNRIHEYLHFVWLM